MLFGVGTSAHNIASFNHSKNTNYYNCFIDYLQLSKMKIIGSARIILRLRNVTPENKGESPYSNLTSSKLICPQPPLDESISLI